jgi:hypothetical protein
MQRDVAVVGEDPRGGVEAFATEALVALRFQDAVDFLGDGVHLPRAGAGGDDEKIDDRRQFREIEDDDVAAAVFVRDPRAAQCAVQALFALPDAVRVGRWTADGVASCAFDRGGMNRRPRLSAKP